MIQKFVNRFMAAQPTVEAELKAAHPGDYDGLVKRVVQIVGVAEKDDWDPRPDPERITVIDYASYQGTRLFIIAEDGYQPTVYWSIFVAYGSCSGCDTLEGIRGYSDTPPTDEQAREYWTLMLHMVESMKQLNDSSEAP